MRAVGFVRKPSEDWNVIKDSLVNIKLLLVSRPGPTVFQVQDEESNLFKVILGNPHTCTCHSSGSSNSAGGCGLCVHQMYCILKVLRIPEAHHLAWQLGFTDSETDQVVAGIEDKTRKKPTRRQAGPSAAAMAAQQAEEEEEMKRKEDAESGNVTRQTLGDDDTCPICQDEMSNEQALSWCRSSCGNNMHATCMQSYAQFKISSRSEVVCPYCRAPWAIELLRDDCRGKASLKNSCAPIVCTACSLPEKAAFYRCLECSTARQSRKKPVDICSRCFTVTCLPKTHGLHHFLASEATSTASPNATTWTAILNPRAPPRRLDPEVMSQLQGRDLTVEDYDMLLSFDRVGPPDLPTHILESFDNATPTALDEGVEFKSCWCCSTSASSSSSSSSSSSFSTGMKRLPCGHVAHDACLKNSILQVVSQATWKLGTDLICHHASCQKNIFPGLSRKRYKPPPPLPAGSAPPGDGGASVQSVNINLGGPLALTGSSVLATSSSRGVLINSRAFPPIQQQQQPHGAGLGVGLGLAGVGVGVGVGVGTTNPGGTVRALSASIAENGHSSVPSLNRTRLRASSSGGGGGGGGGGGELGTSSGEVRGLRVDAAEERGRAHVDSQAVRQGQRTRIGALGSSLRGHGAPDVGGGVTVVGLQNEDSNVGATASSQDLILPPIASNFGGRRPAHNSRVVVVVPKDKTAVMHEKRERRAQKMEAYQNGDISGGLSVMGMTGLGGQAEHVSEGTLASNTITSQVVASSGKTFRSRTKIGSLRGAALPPSVVSDADAGSASGGGNGLGAITGIGFRGESDTDSSTHALLSSNPPITTVLVKSAADSRTSVRVHQARTGRDVQAEVGGLTSHAVFELSGTTIGAHSAGGGGSAGSIALGSEGGTNSNNLGGTRRPGGGLRKGLTKTALSSARDASSSDHDL